MGRAKVLGLLQLHSPHVSFLLSWGLEVLSCDIPASHNPCQQCVKGIKVN